MDLTLKRKVINLTYDDKRFEIRIPSAGEITEFIEKQKSLGESDSLSCVLEFLDKCGLPESEARHFDMWSLQEIIESISKKKSS